MQSCLVEDVVVPLSTKLVHHSALLQEVCLDQSSTDVVTTVKVDLDQLAKATTIVVAQRLGIAKGLQQRVCRQHSVLHSSASSKPSQILCSKCNSQESSTQDSDVSGPLQCCCQAQPDDAHPEAKSQF